jgi:hypothetical protein
MQRIGSQRNIEELKQEILNGVRKFEENQQNVIMENMRELEKLQMPSLIYLRRMAVKYRLDRIYSQIVSILIYIQHIITGKPVYKNVLEAAIDAEKVHL